MAQVAANARTAFTSSAQLTQDDRLFALKCIRESLVLAKSEILSANQNDVDNARAAVKAGNLSQSLLKRLDLQSSAGKFDTMVSGVDQVASLSDPCDQVTIARQLAENLELYRVSCPIGVILVIFEARPEVIVNIAALAIKSGNAAILKGGKESLQTQTVLKKVIMAALTQAELPEDFIQFVESRQDVNDLLSQRDNIDLVIPRGSNALVRQIQDSTKIPVLGHADGICAIYVDESADLEKTIRVVSDAKTSYPAACNAVETLLIHSHLLSQHDSFWPTLAKTLLEAGITLHCDKETMHAFPRDAISQLPSERLVLAKPEDFDTEFLSLDLAVKAVSSIAAAISHINQHSSHHTDAIVTESDKAAKMFARGVDSAGVFVNASTRFSDGFRYGFGTEVGVSTSKLHARGPVGLEGLMTYKYVIRSKENRGSATGDFEQDSEGKVKNQFTHHNLKVNALPFYSAG